MHEPNPEPLEVFEEMQVRLLIECLQAIYETGETSELYVNSEITYFKLFD
jgi:hypothetical protein